MGYKMIGSRLTEGETTALIGAAVQKRIVQWDVEELN